MIHITVETLNFEQEIVTTYVDDTGLTDYQVIDRPEFRDHNRAEEERAA